jgi:hypothetical protein
MISSVSPPSISPVQRMRILAVNGGTCERCGERMDPRRLRIRSLPGDEPNPEKRILILCPRCERQVRRFGITAEIQKTWVEQRDFRQRMLLRKILGYHPAPYIPPQHVDLEELYRNACIEWCLNGSG